MQRNEFINFIAKQIGAKSYLEIGVETGLNFSLIDIELKIGIDPILMNASKSGILIETTSDKFFRGNSHKFDIIFIDGSHLYEQVLKDFENSLRHLTSKGVIVLHDCNPIKYEQQSRPPVQHEWCGDVWKVVAKIRSEGEHEIFVIDADYGLGFVIPNIKVNALKLPVPWQQLTWLHLNNYRKTLLNLISVAEFKNYFRLTALPILRER